MYTCGSKHVLSGHLHGFDLNIRECVHSFPTFARVSRPAAPPSHHPNKSTVSVATVFWSPDGCFLDILPWLERFDSPCGPPSVQAFADVWTRWSSLAQSSLLSLLLSPPPPPLVPGKRHLRKFGFQGSSEETRARAGLGCRGGPAWTALGQSGVSTRPFSPTLPVMDRRALFLMASVKVS